MPEMREDEDGNELDAIEAIVLAGIERGGSNSRKVMMLGAALLIAVLGSALVAYIFIPRADNSERYVAVFLPVTEEGAPVADNAQRQKEGFDKAYDETKTGLDEQFIREFVYPPAPDKRVSFGQDIVDEMKALYKDQNIRTFIVTMSGAVDLIKPRFMEWRNSLPKLDQPVLVATVASATDIADRQNGVYRHYVRSSDEANVFATYVEAHNATRVLLFYVDDPYGIKAKDVLRSRLGRDSFKYRDVPVVLKQKDKDAIVDEVEAIISGIGGSNTVVIIVGYGAMIATTIEALRDTKVDGFGEPDMFKGTVLVASTFTEKKWRPLHFDSDRGVTGDTVPFVDTVLAIGPTHLADKRSDRGVVYQFSYLTLQRALHCKDARSGQEHWTCWSNKTTPATGPNDQDWVDVEFTANGDSRVALRLLREGDW